MSLVERLLVRTLAHFMQTSGAGDTRAVFDAHFAKETEEWRRHVWSLAAERAERRVSRGAA